MFFFPLKRTDFEIFIHLPTDSNVTHARHGLQHGGTTRNHSLLKVKFYEKFTDQLEAEMGSIRDEGTIKFNEKRFIVCFKTVPRGLFFAFYYFSYNRRRTIVEAKYNIVHIPIYLSRLLLFLEALKRLVCDLFITVVIYTSLI